MVPEYVSEAMGTVRQGASVALQGYIFKVTVDSSKAGLQRALRSVQNVPQLCARALTHCLPVSLHRAAPRDVTAPSPTSCCYYADWASSPVAKSEKRLSALKRDVDPADRNGYIPVQLSRSRSQTWTARMWPVMQESEHIDAYHSPCMLPPPHDFCANSVESKLVISFQIKNVHPWSGSPDSRDFPMIIHSCSCVRHHIYNDAHWSVTCDVKQLGGKTLVLINVGLIK